MTSKSSTSNRAQHDIGAMTDDGIRFSLFAPRVKQVAIQGNWNDYQSVPLALATNGVWWVSFPLKDGIYHYRFEIVRQEGEEPVLLPDPTGICFYDETLNYSIIEIVQGQPVYFDYRWQYIDTELPPNEQIVLYEMHVGDFYSTADDPDGVGNFDRVIEKLDYLAELGVNTLELMPVNQSATEDNWGYSQHSLYSVEYWYGTPDKLAHLIDECHKRGIRVFHDGVYNHVHEQAVLPQIDYGYWFYEVNPDKPELHFGPKLDYEFCDEALDVYPAREHVLGAIHRWIDNFQMDGIRFDSTRALKHFDVIRWLNDEAHKRSGFKPFFTIAEHLPQDPEITGPDGVVDAAWHDQFYRQLNCTVLGIPHDDREPFDTTELLRLLDAKRDGFASNYNTIRYLNNHDQERTQYLLTTESKLSDEARFRRNKLGASLLMSAPGIPMLYMGEEFGQANARGEHTEQQPLDWSLLDEPPNRDLFEHYKKLITFRKSSPAICSDYFEVLADLPERDIIAFKRWNDTGNIVVVIANLRDEDAGEVEIELKGIEGDHWREVIQETEVEANQNQLTVSLGESEVKILVKQ